MELCSNRGTNYNDGAGPRTTVAPPAPPLLTNMAEAERSRDVCVAYPFLPFLTPVRFGLLLEYFESPEAISAASEEAIAALLNIPVSEARLVKNPLQVPAIRRQVAAVSRDTVTLLDAEYPPLLREIIDPPPALFVRGERALLRSHCIAVVGSREASDYAMNVAQRIASDLSHAGLTVVSGMARGVDAAAHRAALEQKGPTIAVLGTGIDVIYPRAHRKLMEDICASGIVVTEFPPGTPPRAANFPIRNRIISGLSLGTVIIEASNRSGSLITARMAAEQGREVFAVPGSIFNHRSEGAHRLIQYGAKLLHGVEDVFEELPLIIPQLRARNALTTESTLLELLSAEEGMTIDAIAAAAGKRTEEIATDLLCLEMQGLIRALPGARFIRSGLATVRPP